MFQQSTVQQVANDCLVVRSNPTYLERFDSISFTSESRGPFRPLKQVSDGFVTSMAQVKEDKKQNL